MNKFTVIVGIDVAKKTLAVCLFCQEKVEDFTLDNDLKGLSDLVNKLYKIEPDPGKVLICCENTGHYSEKLAMIATGEGYFVWVVSPVVISRYEVNLVRVKTDLDDARKIKDFAFAHQHLATQYQIPDAQSQKLKELFQCRKHYVDARQRETNFLKSSQDAANPSGFCLDMCKRTIAELNAKVIEIEKIIKGLITKTPEYNRQYQLLKSVPGIGPISAERFLYVTECFTKFKTWKQLACYIGSAPFEHQSGTSVKRKPRTSKKRHRSFKADLFEGMTSTATRKGQFYYAYYTRMIALNYEHPKIINNIINMALKVIYTLIKNDTPFDKKIFLSQKKSWINLEMS